MSRGDLGEHYADALGYALALANRPAFDRHKIHAALMRHELVLDVQRDQGADKATRTAWSLVDRAMQYAEDHPTELVRFEVPDRIIRYRRDADLVPWNGRTGAADRRVLEGAYLTGLMARSTTFSLSVRTWGLRTGLPSKTVSRSAKRLRAQGLLALRGTHTRRTAAHYRLARPKVSQWDLPPQGGSLVTLRERLLVGVTFLDPDSFERRVLAHDAFRPAALGDKGWKVARRLSDEIALADPADDTLRTLEVYGAVRRGEDGWRRVLEPDFFRALDRIARDADTLGTLEDERQRYQVEREERDQKYPEKSCALLVTLRDRYAWWSTWWGSLEGRRARAA